jgi:hypothetical protein
MITASDSFSQTAHGLMTRGSSKQQTSVQIFSNSVRIECQNMNWLMARVLISFQVELTVCRALDHNALTGPIPNLSALTSLKTL